MSKKVYMIGIGGISMSGIALILKHYGYDVSGTDAVENDEVKILRQNGIKVNIGHKKENITPDIDEVVYTAAISQDNEELLEAHRLNIKTTERSLFLGELTKHFKDTIGISGTHGKTTTSSMVTSVFMEANLDPSVQIGANLDAIDGNYRIGKSDYFIIEACEYRDSFLKFIQRSAIVTNIDDDHLDYFKSIENIQKSFKEYVSHLPSDGLLVLNYDDPKTLDLKDYTKASAITTSMNTKDADYFATNIEYDEFGNASYDVYYNDDYVTNVKLGVKGKHNVINSLECFALCRWYGISVMDIVNGIKKYKGASRRMEYKGNFMGANVYDDYGHHPTEIEATANAILKMKHNESYVIFEGHTYSRVYEHIDSFVKSLTKFDHIIVIDIYAAREKNIYNIHAKDIVDKLKKENKDAIYISDYDEIKKYLKDRVKEDDLVLTLGAGNVTKISNILVED